MTTTDGGDADPVVAGRLAEDMRSLANLVDTAPVASFVFDDVFSAAERLMMSLETAVYAAQQERRL